MPAKYKDYPIYTYDEPTSYNDFSGGINTDPSNEHLTSTELRDCVNMTYLSGALVKRKGAKKLCTLKCDEDLINIQGVFLFTYRITYIIVASNGRLYQGVYNPNTTIELSQIPIWYEQEDPTNAYDASNSILGINEEIINDVNTKHDGFISTYWYNSETEEVIKEGNTYEYADLQNGSALNRGMLITNNGFTYLVLQTIQKNENNSATLLQSPRYLIQVLGPGVSTTWHIRHQMVFQNYKQIEAATYNNKLYIATGTRIVEVYLATDSLHADVIKPYFINNSDAVNIGVNYLSPYPELAIASTNDAVTTQMTGINISKDIYGKYTLMPIMNIRQGDSPLNYKFRWEKYIDGRWVVILPFAATNESYYQDSATIKIIIDGREVEVNDQILRSFPNFMTISVTDADRYLYRCTFAGSFEESETVYDAWDITSNYSYGDKVMVGAKVYKCILTHSAESVFYYNNGFTIDAYVTVISEDAQHNQTTSQELKTLWEEVYNVETVLYQGKYSYTDQSGNIQTTTYTRWIQDYVINKVNGEPFGSATSVLWNNNLAINDNFLLIHSCTKVITDGDKLLYYGDKYNSGQWFKTIINNPYYITDRGSLSFKTTKNEALLKVVHFQGNLIAFAYSELVGGSMHLIQGNGDDYNANDGYYSPYQRKIINTEITTDNANSVQICDNLLVFKFFNRVYYLNASELSNDVVKLYSINDRVLSHSQEVKIPWNDNDCVSEVTDSYYALLWKEKYSIDASGNLVQERPGYKVKMYYKLPMQITDNIINLPWLRDESDCFNVDYILYINGKPIYLYNNLLLTFDDEYYQDLDQDYNCYIHTKGYDLGYAKQMKLVESILLYYHHNQYDTINIELKACNEAGHSLVESKKNTLKSIQDLKVLQADTTEHTQNSIRVDSTIQDTKLLHADKQFPCLLADIKLTASTKGVFDLSSITFNYTTLDEPNTQPYDLYANVIRFGRH